MPEGGTRDSLGPKKNEAKLIKKERPIHLDLPVFVLLVVVVGAGNGLAFGRQWLEL